MNIDIKSVLEIVVGALIVVIVPLLSKYLVTLITSLAQKAKSQTDDIHIQVMIDDILEILVQSVVSTSQTFVDELKKIDKFDMEAQKMAFEITRNKVLQLMTPAMVDFISKTYGNFDLWLETKIEAIIRDTKI